MRTIIIADNQDITKAGLLFLLEQLKDVGSIREVESKKELVRELISEGQAVIILDHTLFDFSGADELLILKERFQKTDWLLFSDELSDDFLKRLILHNSSFSVVLKNSRKEEITGAIRGAIRSERFICSSVTNQLFNNTHQPAVPEEKLTGTEKLILKEIALGKTTKEIAADRNLSFHTVTTHRKNIFRKLEVNNIHEATKYAMRAGIVDLAEYYI